MARAARAVAAALLASRAAGFEEVSPSGVQSGLEQAWGGWNLDDLKQQVKSGLNEHKDSWRQSIEDYQESATDYAKGLKDKAFRRAIAATGICKYLPTVSKDVSGNVEEKIPPPMSSLKPDPSTDAKACEAVADEVTVEEIKGQIKSGDVGKNIVDQLLKLITQQSSAKLCEGKDGIKDWLKNNEHLRKADPKKYQAELRKQLRGKVGPVLESITKRFCQDGEHGDSDEDEGHNGGRLFETGHVISAVGSRASAAAGVAAVSGVTLLGLSVLAVRRGVHRAQAQELEPLSPEDGVEGQAL